MLDPSDPTCHTVVDEFSVGEELIVAPVIHVGTTEREVYLPAGVWKVYTMMFFFLSRLSCKKLIHQSIVTITIKSFLF